MTSPGGSGSSPGAAWSSSNVIRTGRPSTTAVDSRTATGCDAMGKMCLGEVRAIIGLLAIRHRTCQ